MDKDKLILVFYVDVSKINMLDIPVYLDEIAKSFRFDDSVKSIIIPVRNRESGVECINPALLTEERYKEIEEKADLITKEFDDFMKSLKDRDNDRK